MVSRGDSGAVSRVNSRRIQMSGVFQVVRTVEPGVPSVPNPPGAYFQVESLKSGLDQLSSAGLSVV